MGVEGSELHDEFRRQASDAYTQQVEARRSHTHTVAGALVGMHTDMSMDVYIDIRIGMHIDMYLSMHWACATAPLENSRSIQPKTVNSGSAHVRHTCRRRYRLRAIGDTGIGPSAMPT